MSTLAMRSRSAVPRRDSTTADILAAVARLDADVRGLASRVAQLETRSGPRDAEDAALLSALALTAGEATFTARAVLAHARVDAALRGALVAADITSARQLGKWLRRLTGTHGGYVLARVGEGRAGIVWTLRRVG
jgi:hypothetical protein